MFTCTVGRKRSQARYYLNDSEEVATLLEEMCLTLPGATPLKAEPPPEPRSTEGAASPLPR